MNEMRRVNNTRDQSPSGLGLVADGEQLLREAARPHVEAEVRARYAEALASASWWELWRIEAEIRAEVERRLTEVAPPEALY